MSLQEINEAIDSQGRAFDEFKKANDDRIEAIQKGQASLAAELDQRLERINTDITKFGEVKTKIENEIRIYQDRIEELEAKAKDPNFGPNEKLRTEHKTAFFDWVRSKGTDVVAQQKMTDAHKQLIERKDVTIGSLSGGGYAVPEEISRMIERQELLFSPVRRLVKVVQVGTSDYKELISLRGASSGWVGETGNRPATDTPILREVTPTMGELYAYPQVSEWSLDDIFFNVEQWLSEEVADEFAFQEGTAAITGNGVSKLTGMLNTAPTLDDDFSSPLRAAAAYQYVPCANADSPSLAAIDMDCLIDLIYKLNSRYRAGATFVMNSLTAGSIRKLKDNQGQYLWEPSTQAGEPARLLGYAHETWEQMPDVTDNAFPIAFGNFRRAYTLVDRTGLRITVDNVTNIGFVRYYIRRREGGIVTNNDAVKFLRTTIS